MQSVYTIIVVVLYVTVNWPQTWSWTKQSTSEHVKESLISEQYRSLILTVGCIAVGIVYCADNCHFEVFYSHARDIYDKRHTEGTYLSADHLVQYFPSLYGVTDVNELKGLHVTKYKWHDGKQQCRRCIKYTIRSTELFQKPPLLCHSSLFYMLLNHFTLWLLELKYFRCNYSKWNSA